MSRFRTRWLALFGGVTLIVLSLSSALGAKPDAETNRGLEVTPVVHTLEGDVEDNDEQGEDDGDEAEEDDDGEVEDADEVEVEEDDDGEVEDADEVEFEEGDSSDD